MLVRSFHARFSYKYLNHGNLGMKVLITSTIFPPERHPSGIIIEEFAEYLTIKGWEVTIVTGFPNHPFGKLFAGYKRQLIQTEKQDGLQVIRTWHIINSSPLLGKRALVMVSQVLGYLFGALSRPRVDLVTTFGPPILG